MNYLAKLFLLGLCVLAISAKSLNEDDYKLEDDSLASMEAALPEQVKSVQKRQVMYPGFFNYYDAFLEYTAYDYYDWVCTDTDCQLCDILTGQCCNPNVQANCIMPDSCVNNPCLSGGTCVTSRTIDNRPDFVCICTLGLTGKYCQLIDDFAILGPVPGPIPLPPPPAPAPAPAPYSNNNYQQPQQQQQAPQNNYQQPQQQQLAPQNNYQQPQQQQLPQQESGYTTYNNNNGQTQFVGQAQDNQFENQPFENSEPAEIEDQQRLPTQVIAVQQPILQTAQLPIVQQGIVQQQMPIQQQQVPFQQVPFQQQPMQNTFQQQVPFQQNTFQQQPMQQQRNFPQRG